MLAKFYLEYIVSVIVLYAALVCQCVFLAIWTSFANKLYLVHGKKPDDPPRGNCGETVGVRKDF